MKSWQAPLNPIYGHVHSEGIYNASMPFTQLSTLVHDPNILQSTTKASPMLLEEIELHSLVQRAIVGSKKRNIPKYAGYIGDIVSEARTGVLPSIHLWSPNAFAVAEDGSLQIPYGAKMIAIDGETQLCAHFHLQGDIGTSPELRRSHQQSLPLSIVIHHGIGVAEAQQFFYDLNVLGHTVNTAVALSMNNRDPLSKIISTLERGIPQLTNKIEREKRSISKKSDNIVKIQDLRQMIINIGFGVQGVQYGAKPVPLESIDLSRLEDVSLEFLRDFFSQVSSVIGNREDNIINKGAVLSAIGAMAHEIYTCNHVDRAGVQRKILARIEDIDFGLKGHWVGIAGKHSDTKVITVSGVKEVTHSILNAMANTSSDEAIRVTIGRPSV